MANTVLTPSIIAAEALRILDNNCVMAKLVYRGYEEEFSQTVNGYNQGDTVSIRRPTDFTVRDGRTASIQDATEGKIPLVVDKQKGVDFQFTANELTLNISKLSERVIKPAMVQLANQVDRDLLNLYTGVANVVGTPALNIDSFADFAKGPERLDLGAVPYEDRSAVLSPTDSWAMLGAQTALYMQDVAKDAYRRGALGMIGNVDTYASQNVQTLTTGSRTSRTGTVVASMSSTYAATLNSNTMTLGIASAGFSITATITAGEVITLDGVFAVNPVTKATLAYLQPFVIRDTITTVATTATTTVTITPPIITTGAFQTVSAAPAASATVTFISGATASTNLTENLIFHKNAFGLVMVPLVKPPGAVDVSRQSYKGYSVRVIPYYSGSNDVSAYRLDILYGVKVIDPRLATRIHGT